jgi:hypothetical protein
MVGYCQLRRLTIIQSHATTLLEPTWNSLSTQFLPKYMLIYWHVVGQYPKDGENICCHDNEWPWLSTFDYQDGYSRSGRSNLGRDPHEAQRPSLYYSNTTNNRSRS